jgi:hypothetical protein
VIPNKERDADQINNNIETLKERRLLALRNYIAEEIPKTVETSWLFILAFCFIWFCFGDALGVHSRSTKLL